MCGIEDLLNEAWLILVSKLCSIMPSVKALPDKA